MKPLETFYEECIESKIAQCDSKAKCYGRSPCTRNHAALKQAQAAFFEDQKHRLVWEMVEEGIGMDLSKINNFLTRSFVLSYLRGQCHAEILRVPVRRQRG